MMRFEDHRDFLGGLLMLASGLATVWQATSYDIDSLRRMGPGYFPLGAGMARLGVYLRRHRRVRRTGPIWRPELGYVAVVFISALGDRQNTVRGAALLGAVMTAACVLIGVLPGMGALSAISMLLPLTYTMAPIPAILMLAGIFYGSQYGGAIGAILLNLPCHPPHALTCLDGYPLTQQGKGGTALGITMISSFFAASVGIIVMIVASPLLVRIAFQFGPAEIFSIMLLGLLAGPPCRGGRR